VQFQLCSYVAGPSAVVIIVDFLFVLFLFFLLVVSAGKCELVIDLI